MTSKKMFDALNNQINEEMYSSYIYLSMASYFESVNLPGFANWMEAQFQEELAHVMRFYKYVNDRDGRVVLGAIKEPQAKWKSPLDAFKSAYEHEKYITSCIGKLVDLAMKESDHPTNNFLQWFVNEQIEEEATSKGIVDQLEFVESDKVGLYHLDRELASRQATSITPPA
ncbi:MAG: ferritin [Candidatus Hinthialibacter antarcticus]|nr:ferritin [Candidatus Hinthialibacter antarcticus]